MVGADTIQYDINISAVESSTDIRIQLDVRPGSLSLKEATRVAGCISTAISEILGSPRVAPGARVIRRC